MDRHGKINVLEKMIEKGFSREQIKTVITSITDTGEEELDKLLHSISPEHIEKMKTNDAVAVIRA
jgi:MoaA/NifB/PqqE/SkfB family radical SAM enzyme